jgi:sugar porter (SP) family MFS transporter
MIFVAIAAALAGLLFGYDVGSISGALLYIEKDFILSPWQQGFVVGAVPFGALLTSLVGGMLNDKIGRKKSLLLTALLFIGGALICAVSISIAMLICGRLLIGLAIGIGSFSAPLYIAEMSEERHRGGLVTLNQLAIVCGICLAYGMNYLLSSTENWRLMLGFATIPGLILLVSSMLLPESPRWLMLKNQFEKAKHILCRIHGKSEGEAEFHALSSVIKSEHSISKKTFRKDFYKVLALGILVSILTQAVGINAIIYYAPKIFLAAGIGAKTSAILATFGIGLVNVIFTLVAVRFLDQFGRRKLLLTGVFGIALSLLCIVIVLHFMVLSSTVAWIIFGCFLLFIACQAIGTGPACWLIPSEIFPLSIRGLGMGLSVAANWGTNVIVALLFPIVLKTYGVGVSFFVFLVIAIIAWIYFYTMVPETKDVSLETIESNLYANKKMRDLGASR